METLVTFLFEFKCYIRMASVYEDFEQLNFEFPTQKQSKHCPQNVCNS